MENQDEKNKKTSPMEVEEPKPSSLSDLENRLLEKRSSPTGIGDVQSADSEEEDKILQESQRLDATGGANPPEQSEREVIRPRKPRSNRKSKKRQTLEDNEPPGNQTLGEKKPSVQPNPTGDTTATTSEQNPEKTSKRGHSDTSTPSPLKKKSKQEPGGTIPSTSTGVITFKQALTSTKMAIAPTSYPEDKLTLEQAKQLQLAITKEIWKCEPGTGPQFAGSYPQTGVLIITCENEASKAWLKLKVPSLELWEGVSLRVDDAKEILKTNKVLVWVPTEFLEVREPARILQLLQTQNMGLKTEEWRIIGSRSETQGITLVLGLDDKTLEELSKRGFKAYIGLTQITFRVNYKINLPCVQSIDPIILGSITKASCYGEHFVKTLGITFFDSPVHIILEFLSEVFHKGASYGTINCIRAALSLIMSPDIESDYRIKRFMKGVQNIRPSKPRYNYTWDPSVVLKHLRNMFPNESLTLQLISYKLVTLLALVTAHRVQTLSLIKIENIGKTPDGIEIMIPYRIKTFNKNKAQPLLFLPKYTQDPGLCVVNALEPYIKKTEGFIAIGSRTNLFITFKRPYHETSAQTLSRTQLHLPQREVKSVLMLFARQPDGLRYPEPFEIFYKPLYNIKEFSSTILNRATNLPNN
ncbi:hypothetical protein NQ317_007931 [Molorchus minor]|uniref:DUF4780 domain-containing protein n=1 Tax=Molorchus minor TaxID=1323400 RepID=A0ABQ9JQF7_9CUCU|nr:hypothetical protein NQ317_007931 [Molorchus minor]